VFAFPEVGSTVGFRNVVIYLKKSMDKVKKRRERKKERKCSNSFE